MKIQFSALAAAALALLLSTACQREELANDILPGEEVNVTISAVMPSGGPEVKSAEDPGDGSAINRCVLGVYLVNGSTQELYGYVMYEAVSGGTATFEDVALLTGYDYKLVFWADNVEEMPDLSTDNHYTVSFAATAPQVSYKSEGTYTSSDDTRDAFFGVFDLKGFSGTVEDSYTLTRPFGQLNIFTTDYSDIKSKALKPAKVQITFPSIPTGMNLLTGATTSSTAVTGTVSSIPTLITSPVVSGAKQLSFDYIFAPADQQLMLQNIKMAFFDESGNQLQIEPYTFPELPVQRNYRTNVSGALLTKSADLTITISKDFTGDFERDVTTVEETGDVQSAISGGANQVYVTKPASSDITIPTSVSDEEDLAVTVNGASTDFSVKSESTSDEYAGSFSIGNGSEEKIKNKLTINLPQATASVTSGSWSQVEATTAQNTIIIGRGAEVETLTVKKGNVEIYGRVGNMEFDDQAGIVKVFTVYDDEAFEYALSLLLEGKCEKIVLASDITYQKAANTLHTISGDKTVTVDLNDRTLVLDGVRLYTDEGASLSFCDGTIECKNVAAGTYPLAVQDNASMVLENVRILRTGGCAVGVSDAKSGGKLNIRGCIIESLTFAVGTNASSPVSQNVEIVIENSTLTGYTPLFLNIPLKATVTGCTLKGSSQGMILRGGNATVRDCEIVLETSEAVNSLIKNEWGVGYEAHNASFNEHDWGSGNDVPNAALTIGNKGTGYQYPTVLNIENTSLAVTGPYVKHCHEVYVHANEGTGMGVNITFDGATGFEDDAVYGNDGKNITVNGSALDLSNQVFEVSTLEELLANIQTLATSGGTLIITEGSGIQLTGDSFTEPLAINKPTVIRVNGTLTSEDPGFYLKNNSTLKIEGSGNVKFNSKIVFNYGMLTVTGGSYHTDDLDDGCVFGNVEETAVMILNDVTVNASRFAVAGSGRIDINGGVISSISCNWQGKYAYCIRSENGGDMTIRDAEVNGIQGCIASIEGSHVLLDNVRAYAKNTEGRADAWYALYPASLGVIEVLSGEYYSDRTPCCYASDDDIELNTIGRFILKGGKYSSMPKVYNKPNETTSDALAAPGYKFQEITGDSQFKYEVVPE